MRQPAWSEWQSTPLVCSWLNRSLSDSYEEFVHHTIPFRVSQCVVLCGGLLWQLRIAQRITELLQIAAVHRPALRQIDHAPEQLAEHHPIVIRVVAPKLRLLVTEPTNNPRSDLVYGHLRPTEMRNDVRFDPIVRQCQRGVLVDHVKVSPILTDDSNGERNQRKHRPVLNELGV